MMRTLAAVLRMLPRVERGAPGTPGVLCREQPPPGRAADGEVVWEEPLGTSNPLVLLHLDLPSWRGQTG